ncbi:MAG: cation transporter [Solirubrobacterales bacterium]|nr:cation transporter [Solirubrobacterales bacterium]
MRDVGHEHDHHGHHGHDHAHVHVDPATADRGPLAIALAIILVFMVVEVVAGLVADSVALLSDAAHMLTDAGAIGLALVAARLASRPARGPFTFGLGRAEVLSAQVNGAVLLALAAVLGYEALGRLADPPDVEGGLVIVVGAAGAVANVAAAFALARASRRSLNVEGAMAHVMTDLYGSVAAIVAGVLVVTAGFELADPIAALVVVALMLRSSWYLLRASGRVLLEAAPTGIDVQAVGTRMSRHPGVVEVHDLHVWELTSDFPALAAHVMVASGADCHSIRRELEAVLRQDFDIEHTTLQVDHAPAPGLVQLEPRAH